MKLKSLLAVFVCLTVTSLTFAAESILSVAYRDVNRLAVELSGVSEARSLWIALDSADKDTVASNWSYWCHAADVAVGTTSVDVVLPSKKTLDGCKVLRCALLSTDILPGAERLTSITPQSALVKTDFRPTGWSSVEIDVKLATSARALFCSRLVGYPNADFFSLLHIDATRLRYDYDANQWYATPVAANTRYAITAGPTGLCVRKTDGTVAASLEIEGHGFTAGSDLYLFGTHSDGKSPGAYFDGTFYGLKAWTKEADPDALVLNLIPARKDGVVGLFDATGGGLLTPSNTGTLSAGEKAADVGEPIAWSPAVSMTNVVVISAFDNGARRLDIRADKVVTAGSLWLAYGATDSGSDISAWPHFACVGEVKVGETLKQVRAPKDWDDQVQCARVFLLASESLPDAVRLASVSPKSALVKTDFRPTGRSRVEIDAELATSGRALFCSRMSSYPATNSYSIMHFSDTVLRYDYDGKNQQVSGVAKNTRYSITIGPTGLSARKADGSVAASHEVTGHDFTAGSDLYLFGTHNNGSNPGGYFDGIFYGLKAWASDTTDPDGLVLDLVPAKKNSTVGLYDRRSGTFLPATNSGSMEAGAEQAAANDVLSGSAVYVHAPCTVAVVSQTRRKLTVALSGVETDSELWIAADSRDRADDTLGWNEYVKVADIVRGQTSAEVALPESWRKISLKIRCILYSKEAAPGYTRLVSVTPRQNAYVNTHFTPSGTSAVETVVCYNSAPGNEGLFCARAANAANAFALLHLSGKGLRYDYVTADNSKFLLLPSHERHALRMDATGITWDNEPTPRRINSEGEKQFTAGGELYLWCAHSGGGSIASPMTGMFYGCTAWSDYRNRNEKTLSFDIVPCQGNNGAFLFDRKTRQPVPLSQGSLDVGDVMGDGVIAQSKTVDKPVLGLFIVIK